MTAGDDKHQRIIRNVVEDPCVDVNVAREFFDELAASGPITSADDALKQAYDIVRHRQSTLTCSGRAVSPNTDRFDSLVRIDRVEDLRFRVPDACDDIGLTESMALEDVSEEDLQALTDDYDGPVELGNLLGVVWATDDNVLHLFPDSLEEAFDRLGLIAAEAGSACVLCVYTMANSGMTLHAPRVLDAINSPLFFPNPDCSDDHGRTLPLVRLPNQGFPEIVHRSCQIIPDRWELVA